MTIHGAEIDGLSVDIDSVDIQFPQFLGNSVTGELFRVAVEIP